MECFASVYIHPSYGYVCFMPRTLAEILSRWNTVIWEHIHVQI